MGPVYDKAMLITRERGIDIDACKIKGIVDRAITSIYQWPMDCTGMSVLDMNREIYLMKFAISAIVMHSRDSLVAEVSQDAWSFRSFELLSGKCVDSPEAWVFYNMIGAVDIHMVNFGCESEIIHEFKFGDHLDELMTQGDRVMSADTIQILSELSYESMLVMASYRKQGLPIIAYIDHNDESPCSASSMTRPYSNPSLALRNSSRMLKGIKASIESPLSDLQVN